MCMILRQFFLFLLLVLAEETEGYLGAGKARLRRSCYVDFWSCFWERRGILLSEGLMDVAMFS